MSSPTFDASAAAEALTVVPLISVTAHKGFYFMQFSYFAAHAGTCLTRNGAQP
jgi:hypothetical protein